MKKWIMGICICAAFFADARIGETLEECKQRYGSEPEALNHGWYAYTMGHYYIEVHITSSRVVDAIAIQRHFHGKPIDMLASEIKSILLANTDNQPIWYEHDKTITTQDWRLVGDQTGNLTGGNSQSRIYIWKSRDQKHASYDAQAKVLLLSSQPKHPYPPEADRF